MSLGLRYEQVPPWEVDIEEIEAGGLGDKHAILILRLKDHSVMPIECKAGVILHPNKRQRLHRDYFGAVYRSEIIENAKVAELADAPA